MIAIERYDGRFEIAGQPETDSTSLKSSIYCNVTTPRPSLNSLLISALLISKNVPTPNFGCIQQDETETEMQITINYSP
ncbi:unnamed protein product [Bursaphelenchus xylophilus]|uniref:(pine wood nematode) hypothetical protein n=1 Tax=Bursaphelenchus xylophilus TaxID=6326 RepID=A0A1I7SKF4_BURXY|nr:unnamed protein product [Bursaphelenchus xylophilus]CAG9131264.1 unnamed protein product [Bursaphelenchus xylophilus]